MASELESKIMAEIGLDKDPSLINNTKSCESIKKGLAYKLRQSIERQYLTDERSICYPDARLINLVGLIASNEEDQTITSTYEAASAVITAHIDYIRAPFEGLFIFRDSEKYLLEKYSKYIPRI